ncbi:TolC family protein [Sulfurospirillum sp. 1612]|uniref:TolC family protein n=1 Tax=Sulfurospirillum sp. 1612 TaxID=3094835 RepID=UPI002F947D1A
MKKLLFILLILSTYALAATLPQIIASSETNPSIQAAQQQAKAYEHLLDVAKSSNYPSLDLSYGGTYLDEKPVVYLPASLGGGTWQMQSQNIYTGAVSLSYPLFSGFAISARIDEAQLKKQRATLKVKDSKRTLYLNIVHLYTQALAMKHIIVSQKEALAATQESYKKVQGFFEEGMCSSSELYRMEAALHQIQSELVNTKNQYKILLRQLSFLANTTIDTVASLPKIGTIAYTKLKSEALQKRPDIQAMKLLVKETQANIRLAKSGYYPHVALFAQVAYGGDTPALNGDGYTNKNKSAAGFKINYNLFSGFKDDHQIEAARKSKLANALMLQSYTDRVKTELYSTYLTYQSLRSQKSSAQARLKAQETYEKLIKEKFENQLSDADVLSRAISSSAMARAFLIQIEAKLYNAYAKLLLEVNNDTFLASLNNQKDQ